MADSDEEMDSDDPRRQKKEEPMPENFIRFTDMPDALVSKAIRCKIIIQWNF